MAQITRSTKIGGGTTLQSSTLARAADVETDMLTLFNAHNNADTGTVKWQVGSFENATSTVIIANNSTGTNNIAEFRDNGTAVVTIQDGGTMSVAPVSAAGKGVVVNSGTSTGNVLEVQDNGGIVLQVADGGATTVKATDGGSTVAFTANNGTSTGHIAAFQDNGTNAWHIADGGNMVSNSKKITGLAAGSTAGDSVRYEQVLLLAGGTMSGSINMNGSNITNLVATSIKVGAFTADGTTNNQAVTGVGFKPRVVIFVSQASSGGTDLFFSVGAMDGSGNQWLRASNKTNTTAAVVTNSTMCTGLAGVSAASFVSMDSDGFTIDWTDAGTESIAYLAIQ